MARTYRKNLRTFRKVRGEFLKTHDCRSLKGDAKHFRCINLRDPDNFWGGNWFRKEVFVGDGDNWKRGPINDIKKMYRRIDRARYKQALYRNEDANIFPAMDPWGWD